MSLTIPTGLEGVTYSSALRIEDKNNRRLLLILILVIQPRTFPSLEVSLDIKVLSHFVSLFFQVHWLLVLRNVSAVNSWFHLFRLLFFRELSKNAKSVSHFSSSSTGTNFPFDSIHHLISFHKSENLSILSSWPLLLLV